MSNFERKFGKYAISNLTLILIVCYAIGYVVELISPQLLTYFYLSPFNIIYKFQIWRLISWILVPPPGRLSFLTLIMLYFYYSIGNSLENTWGTYKYNVYLFSGLIFTIAGSFLLYFLTGIDGSQMVSTYYVNMSIFLAFAATFPDSAVFLFMILPIKVKYLGIIYGAMLLYELLTYLRYGAIAMCVVIVASLLNFVVFFFTQKKRLGSGFGGYRRGNSKPKFSFSNFGNSSQGTFQHREYDPRNFEKRNESTKESNQNSGNGITRHKCAICGQTDISAPNMTFRFCSKCNGNYEYCANHLFTHKHVE